MIAATRHQLLCQVADADRASRHLAAAWDQLPSGPAKDAVWDAYLEAYQHSKDLHAAYMATFQAVPA